MYLPFLSILVVYSHRIDFTEEYYARFYLIYLKDSLLVFFFLNKISKIQWTQTHSVISSTLPLLKCFYSMQRQSPGGAPTKHTVTGVDVPSREY